MIKKIYFLILNFNYFMLKILNKKIMNNSSFNSYALRFHIRNKGEDNVIKINKECRLQNSRIWIKGNGNKIFLEDNVILKDCIIVLNGDNNFVHIGENNIFKQLEININHHNNTFYTGSDTTSSGKIEVQLKEGTSINIGSNCLLSRNIIIRTSDGHSILENNERINNAESVFIGNECWISQNATILKGSYINSGSIVGAGAIVTKKFHKKSSLIVGIPAKIVKENISWNRNLI